MNVKYGLLIRIVCELKSSLSPPIEQKRSYLGVKYVNITNTSITTLCSIDGTSFRGWGNQYWQTYDSQLSAAETMLGTKAVADYFGNALATNEGFVTTIYANTLNKTRDGADGSIADPSGITYWIERLDGTTGTQLTRAEMMVHFIWAASKRSSSTGIQFNNRVEVSNYTADKTDFLF